MPRKALAMVLTAPRRLEARELPVPEVGDDAGLLRVEACGICGTDLEQFEGLIPTPLPAILGHEPVGVIEAIGERAARRWGVQAGDRVAVENILSCGLCAACRGGRAHLCRRRRIYSFLPVGEPPGLWGAYAEYLWLDPDSVLHRIDPALPASVAALFNPLGAGYRWGVEIPNTKPGDVVVILGPGQRGLAAVLACREAGARRIVVTGLAADARKLALARELGADATVDVEAEDVVARVRELTDGRGADVVLDVSSLATAPVREALEHVAPGGTVVLAGVKGWKPVPDFVSDKIVVKEISVRGAIGVTSSAYANAIRLIESRPELVAKLHTHDFALRDAERAIRTLARQIPGEDAIHCCLLPGRT